MLLNEDVPFNDVYMVETRVYIKEIEPRKCHSSKEEGSAIVGLDSD